MRQATEHDLDFLADCYVKIACHMKAGEQDFYIARLPEAPDETIRTHVARYVGREDALTLLEEVEGTPIACLLASIGGSSFAASRVGKSGHIAVCWVERENRRTGIAAKLVSAAEDWFRQKVVGVVELSYMVKNELGAVPGNNWATNPPEFSPTSSCKVSRILLLYNFCLHLAVAEKFRYQAAQKASEARRAKFDEVRRTLQYVEASRASATTHMRLFEPPSRFPIPARGSPT